MDNFWAEETLVREIPAGRDLIRVKLVTNNRGARFIDIRRWYNQDGNYLPGKGISLPLELGDQVADAIIEALQ